MGEYHINGGRRLSGRLRVCGGKNAILPILAAAVLNRGESVLRNCPRISDTFVSMDILKAIGCQVSLEGNTLRVDAAQADRWEIPEGLVREMRSSIIFLGGVLGRFGKVKISYPGGCGPGWEQ